MLAHYLLWCWKADKRDCGRTCVRNGLSQVHDSLTKKFLLCVLPGIVVIATQERRRRRYLQTTTLIMHCCYFVRSTYMFKEEIAQRKASWNSWLLTGILKMVKVLFFYTFNFTLQDLKYVLRKKYILSPGSCVSGDDKLCSLQHLWQDFHMLRKRKHHRRLLNSWLPKTSLPWSLPPSLCPTTIIPVVL